MRYFLISLVVIGPVACYSQQSNLEEIIKQIKQSEILPVRKLTVHFPGIAFYRWGTMVRDSIVYLPASPINPLYFPEGDQRLLSNLSISVKKYLINLNRKKKRKGE